jgi:hypothetical protein
MLPTNGRPTGPGGSGSRELCHAFPRDNDLAKSKASDAVKIHARITGNSMVTNIE